MAREFVRAHPVGQARRFEPGDEIELQRIVGRPERTDKSDDEQKANQETADRGILGKFSHCAVTRGSNSG